MSVDCVSKLEGDGTRLHAVQVRKWIENIPDGAVVSQIVRDFGTQRDPEERLVGLRAAWSETR